MANLLSTGISGLNAAQLALDTVGNNIANVSTPGYSRQSTVQADRVGTFAGGYTIGNGVDVVSVQRAYSQYLTTALWSSTSALQGATTSNDLASTLNGLLSGSGDLQSALDDFYGAFGTLAGDPGDSSSRQALLGSASSLAATFNTLGQQLAQQQSQVDTQVAQTVDSINTTTASIAKLNQQIMQASASGNAPNALLDQRDSLVDTLSGYLGITASFNSDGSLSIYSSSGQSLVSGANAFALSSGGNSYDAGTTDVFDASGNDISNRISGGSLGALLNYRSQVLTPAQNQLGLAALGLASSVNAQQAKGLGLDGKPGQPLFDVPSPAVSAAAGNQGGATVKASIGDVSQLTGADYVLSYDGSQWSLATTSGQQVTLTENDDGSLSADGLSFAVSGDAQAGDSYLVEPSRGAAAGLGVALDNPDGIAAAAALTASAAGGNTGLDDNSNALALAGLDDTGVLDGGKTSILDSYAELTTRIGDAGSQAQDELTTQTALNNQAVSAQQSVSGVNLDEEAANMVRYQQAYQASAQIISTAQTLFSSLLAAVQG